MSKNSFIKIMCLGDSITLGHRMPGSYRKFLYHNLITKGYKIKMVGAINQKKEKYYSKEDKSEFFEYEDNHCGFSAYSICAYRKRKGLLELLQKNKYLKLNPDIIILLIGTNNAMDNYDFDITIKDFISLINYLVNNISKEAIILVSTIPDMNPNIYKTWFGVYQTDNYSEDEAKNKVNDYIMKFNKEITGIIEDYRNKNYNIRIGDLNPVIKDIDNLLFDGVHPNNKGYKIIGDFWADIIDKYLTEHFKK